MNWLLVLGWSLAILIGSAFFGLVVAALMGPSDDGTSGNSGATEGARGLPREE